MHVVKPAGSLVPPVRIVKRLCASELGASAKMRASYTVMKTLSSPSSFSRPFRRERTSLQETLLTALKPLDRSAQS